MFKKINTTTLVIILVLLGGLALLNKFYFSKKSESTFDSSFIKIDSSAVSQIVIYPKAEKGKEIKLIRNGSAWNLQNDKVKTAADTAEVHRLLASFVDLKTSSLAAEDKSGWGDFQVSDTAGSRIKFITDNNQTYEMIVGKFGFSGGRSGVTYMRHKGEDAVYSVEGYISFNVNRDFTSWRMKTVMAGNKDTWSSLTFTYPADSGFTLVKQNNKWMVNGFVADSNKTNQYLTQLANKQSPGFIDQYTPNGSPIYTVTISGSNPSKPITVQAFPADSTQKFIIHSSLNPDAWFSEAKNPIVDGIFVRKEHFLKQ